MPETNKLDEHDKGFSDMHDEPASGARKKSRWSARSPSADAEGRPYRDAEGAGPAEPAREPPSGGNPEDDGIAEFAESVVSGLAQAGLDAGTSEDSGRQADNAPESSEAFFAGWDGPGESRQAPAQPEHELPGHRTLSEIGSASAAMIAADYNGAIDIASSKHDELADAVQSALLSVYGDPPARDEDAHSAGVPYSQQVHSPGAGWNTGSRPGSSHPGEDALSPQEVILNYFTYDPNARNGNGHSPGPFNGSSGYENDYAAARSGQGHYQVQRQPQWSPAAYPVPAGPNMRPKAAGAAERGSGRLLGAAAIGLVGGIAIAATLAVFVINSRSPDARVPAGSANQSFDEPGYGRTIGDGEGREALGNPVATLPPVEILGEVVASDVVATAGQPTALAIGIKSQHPLEQMLVSITGIPEGARLNAGIDAGGGNWLLPPRRLNGLSINLPAGTPDILSLEVQLLDSNVRTALSVKRQFVIRVNSGKPDAMADATGTQGASRPPVSSFSTQTIAVPPTPSLDSSFQTQTVTSVPPFQAALVPANPPGAQPSWGQDGTTRKPDPKPEVEDLIREGNKRMREGDILEARQFYQKAVLLGDPEAALAMGRSYDPIYFARIDRKNAEPDAAKALDWYRKAMDGGATQTAKLRIENLKHFLNE